MYTSTLLLASLAKAQIKLLSSCHLGAAQAPVRFPMCVDGAWVSQMRSQANPATLQTAEGAARA